VDPGSLSKLPGPASAKSNTGSIVCHLLKAEEMGSANGRSLASDEVRATLQMRPKWPEPVSAVLEAPAAPKGTQNQPKIESMVDLKNWDRKNFSR
jgi:hypothetical protein